MASPAYSNDLTTIALGDLNYDAGTWDESSNAGWDTAGAMVDDENLQYTTNSDNSSEAADSCTSAQYTKDGTGSGTSGPGTIMYEHTSTFTVPTDGIVAIHHLWAAPSALNAYAGTFGTAEAGISVLIGSSLGDFDVHYVSGSDKPPAPEGGWTTYFVDPTLTPAGTVGTVGTFDTVGVAVAGTAQARGNPQACQAVRYGRGEVEYTVGDSTTPATFAGYATIDNDSADRFNLLQNIEGGYKARGLMTFGTATTAVYFDDANVSIVIADDLKVGTSFNKGVVNNASSELYWDTVAITNLGTVALYTFTVNNSATTEHNNCTFTDVGSFTYGSNSTNTNTIYRRMPLITQGSGTFTGCTFDNATGTVALSVDTLGNVTKCQFNSDGTGHAVDLGNVTTTQSMSWDNTESGYASTSGSTGNETILVNVSTGETLTINVAATGSTPTYKNDGSGTVSVVAGQKNFVVEGLELNTEVTIVTAGTTTVLHHTENASTSDGNGKYKITYAHSGGASVDVLIHHVDYVPDVNNSYGLTLPSNDSSLKVAMTLDGNYENP